MGKRTSQGRLHSDRSCPKTSKETSNADDWLFYRRRFYALYVDHSRPAPGRTAWMP